MMEIKSGVVRFTKNSVEEQDFNTLHEAIVGMSDVELVRYHNELIRLGRKRTHLQNLMLTVIAYERGTVKKEYFETK